MKIFGFNITRASKQSAALTDPGGFWSGDGNFGVSVSHKRAMQSTAVYGSVRILSSVLASFPLNMYRRVTQNGSEGKEKATDHPLYKLFRGSPNSFQDNFVFKQTLQTHLSLRGNFYGLITRKGSGEIVSIIPLSPDRMTPQLNGERIRYSYLLENGQSREFLADEILHIKCFSSDGIIGIDPINQMGITVGTAIATEEHTARFFANGTRLGGILKYPGKLSNELVEKIKKSWSENAEGAHNAGKTRVLEEGMTYEPLGLTSEQSELLAQRGYNKKDICMGIFGVPAAMLGDDSTAFTANVEEFSQQFIDYTMRPILTCIEQSLSTTLLTESEQEEYFFEFLTDAFLRGNGLNRAQKLAIERQNGIINADEWRAIENRNPLPDGAGKIYLNPLNMAEAGGNNPAGVKAPQPPGKGLPAPDKPNNDPNATDNQLLNSENIDVLIRGVESLFSHEIGRILRRKVKAGKIEQEFIENSITPMVSFLYRQVQIIRPESTGSSEKVIKEFSKRICSENFIENDDRKLSFELIEEIVSDLGVKK